MEIADQLDRALAQTGAIVDAIGNDQLDLPTPCEDWNVRTVIAHLVRGNENTAAVAKGEPRQPNPIADVGEYPQRAYQESVADVRQAWQDPALLDQTFASAMGDMPGRVLLTLRLSDNVTHGWDLARATGQTPRYDDDIVQTALGFVGSAFGQRRPVGGPFAPPVPVPDSAPPIDRLAAYLGRKP